MTGPQYSKHYIGVIEDDTLPYADDILHMFWQYQLETALIEKSKKSAE